jgi:hypothetical protein
VVLFKLLTPQDFDDLRAVRDQILQPVTFKILHARPPSDSSAPALNWQRRGRFTAERTLDTTHLSSGPSRQPWIRSGSRRRAIIAYCTRSDEATSARVALLLRDKGYRAWALTGGYWACPDLAGAPRSAPVSPGGILIVPSITPSMSSHVPGCTTSWATASPASSLVLASCTRSPARYLWIAWTVPLETRITSPLPYARASGDRMLLWAASRLRQPPGRARSKGSVATSRRHVMQPHLRTRSAMEPTGGELVGCACDTRGSPWNTRATSRRSRWSSRPCTGSWSSLRVQVCDA